VNQSKPDPLIPEFQPDEDDILASREVKPTIRQRLHNWKDSLLKSQNSVEERNNPKLHKYKKENELKFSSVVEEKIKGRKTDKAKCQILRSASNWSIGLKIRNHENSILNAYMALILAAEHFIYIENQFFISSVASSKDTANPVINEIAKALYMRIIRAAKEKRKFKVIVVMPLLPVNNL
jgi:phospholipase D1/2